MKHAFQTLASLVFLLTTVIMHPQALATEDFTLQKLFKGCQVFLGPQTYHVYRTREGGTFQEGWLYGAEAEIKKIRRYKLFWEVKGFISTGEIHGYSGTNNRLASNLTDREIEGRLGYTWKGCKSPRILLTPFFGYGCFNQKNKYKPPSLLKLHFTTSCRYVSCGFLASMKLGNCWSVCGEFSAQYVLEAKNRISKDPVYDNTSQSVGEELQYEIEACIKYAACWCGRLFDIAAVPFFQYRHFGRRENFPFDFLDTKYRNFGLRLGVCIGF